MPELISGVKQHHIYVNGVLSVSVGAGELSKALNNLNADTDYEVLIKTEDNAGNISLGTVVDFKTMSDSGGVSIPQSLTFLTDTRDRKGTGPKGDNWHFIWRDDDSQLVVMDDGSWEAEGSWHNRLYVVNGDETFSLDSVQPLEGYAGFPDSSGYKGWYGYGGIAIGSTIYMALSLHDSVENFQVFNRLKLLKSTDNGQSWSRVNKNGDIKSLPSISDGPDGEVDSDASSEMFFDKEFGESGNGGTGYPFCYLTFVHRGKANSKANDNYVYIHSPNGANTKELNLARVDKDSIDNRDNWEYFKEWSGETPVWTSDIEQRGYTHLFPESNSQVFGWYGGLADVVWNDGLGVYIMVNHFTYHPYGYYDSWPAGEKCSVHMLYSKNPYGPWTEFHHEEHFQGDGTDESRPYQLSLSPKWISQDGTEMVLVWSDSGVNDQGETFTDKYSFNQMNFKINI